MAKKKKVVDPKRILKKVIEVPSVTDKKLEKLIQDYIKSKYEGKRLSKEIYKKWKIGVTNSPDRR